MKTRAIVQSTFGGPDVLTTREIDVATLGAKDVRLRVAAAALNPVDLGTRAGRTTTEAAVRFPLTLGWDVVGVVEEVGVDVRELDVGARVVGMSVMPATQRGTHAEAIVLDAGHVVPIEQRVADAIAAALPLAGVTALQALAAARLVPGETLLVSSVRSAVGAMAAAIARHREVRVVTFASDPTARAEALALGIEPLMERRAAPRIDVALDVRGGTAARAAHARIRDGGRYVTVVPEWWKAGGPFTREREIDVTTVQVTYEREALALLAALAEEGVLRPAIADVYSYDDARLAHERLASAQARGKIILVP